MKSRKPIAISFVLAVAAFATLAFGDLKQLSSFSKSLASESKTPTPEQQISTSEINNINADEIKRRFLMSQQNSGNVSPKDIPDEILWSVIFNVYRTLEQAAEKSMQQGQDGKLFSDYFTRQANLSVETVQAFKQISSEYLAAVRPIEDREKELQGYLKEARKNGRIQNHQAIKTELEQLYQMRKEMILRYRNEFRRLNPTAFSEFEKWLREEFTKNLSVWKLTPEELSSRKVTLSKPSSNPK